MNVVFTFEIELIWHLNDSNIVVTQLELKEKEEIGYDYLRGGFYTYC